MTEQQINTIINIMNKGGEVRKHSAYVLQYTEPYTNISKNQGFTTFDRMIEFINDLDLEDFRIYR